MREEKRDCFPVFTSGREGDVTKKEADCDSVRVLGRSKEGTLCRDNNFTIGANNFQFRQCTDSGDQLPEVLHNDNGPLYTCGNVLSGPPLMCRRQRAIVLFSVCKTAW